MRTNYTTWCVQVCAAGTCTHRMNLHWDNSHRWSLHTVTAPKTLTNALKQSLSIWQLVAHIISLHEISVCMLCARSWQCHRLPSMFNIEWLMNKRTQWMRPWRLCTYVCHHHFFKKSSGVGWSSSREPPPLPCCDIQYASVIVSHRLSPIFFKNILPPFSFLSLHCCIIIAAYT